MLQNLPEGSRYAAALAVDHAPEDTEHDPRTEALMDHRVWTLDRRLTAMQINAMHSLIAVSGEWGKKGPPDFPTIGPSDWQKSAKPDEPKDNFDVLRKMGWLGG